VEIDDRVEYRIHWRKDDGSVEGRFWPTQTSRELVLVWFLWV
jgi:hypothetical protein